MPTRTAGFHIKDVKKNTLWPAPQYTTYKAHKVNMYGTTKEDTFTVSKAETKTKEGSLYYYVTSDNNSAVSGWIFAGEGYKDASSTDFGGLSVNKTEAAATNNNSVKIVYREAGKQVGEATWINSAGNTTAGNAVGDSATNAASVKLDAFAANSMPNGFKIKTDNTIADAVKKATYGNAIYVDVVTAASSKVQLVVNEVTSDTGVNGATVSGPLASGNKLSSSDLAATLSTDGISMLSGEKGTQIGVPQLTKLASEFGKTEIKGTKIYHDTKGDSYYYKFTFVSDKFASDNRLANYGDQLTATYNAVLTKGTPTVSSSNSVWIA